MPMVSTSDKELRNMNNNVLYNLLHIKHELDALGVDSKELKRFIVNTESVMDEPDIALVHRNVKELLKGG